MSEAESPAMACFATGHSKSSRRRLLVAVSGNVLPIPTSFPRILQPLMHFYLISSRAFLPDSDKRYLGLTRDAILRGGGGLDQIVLLRHAFLFSSTPGYSDDDDEDDEEPYLVGPLHNSHSSKNSNKCKYQYT